MSEGLFNPKGAERATYRPLNDKDVYNIIAGELQIESSKVKSIITLVFRGGVSRFVKKGHTIKIDGVGTYIPTRRLTRHLKRKPVAKMIIMRIRNKKRKIDTKRW